MTSGEYPFLPLYAEKTGFDMKKVDLVQIDGKVRATLEVSARIDGTELERLARADPRVQRALGDREITRAIVRPPKVVSFSTT